MAAGTYTTELRITNLNGTASQHIVIKGPDTGPRPLFLGNPVSNVVEISNTSYVELKNIDINAQKLGGDGVNFKGLAHDVILDNLSLRGLSDDQQTVAISANHAPSWNITIRNCVITDAGTGMYLGNSDGSNQFLNGLIENNLIYDTIGYNIEIKYQNPLPTNIADLPLTTTHTIIRDNVFSKANNASGDSLARPNLLVGHAPLSGPGQDNFFEIYGNFFYQNPVEALFQGEGNFALYDNLFFNSMNSGTPAIAIQPHINLPRAVRVFNNTVVTVNTGISLTGGSSSYAQKVIGNAVFSPSPIQAADQFGNITGTYQNASNYLNNPFAALGSMDLFPKVGELSGTALDTSSFNTYTDFDQDFNGTVRTTASFRGAYFGEGQNPGWLPQIAIKPVSATGASPATLSLAFNGLLRDRVGQDNTALGPDGALDGTLTATLSASGGRTVTALRLDSSAPGIWDTISGNGFWALAVAPTLDGAILNAPGTMAVNFPVVDGGSFVVFAADYQGGEFLLGRTLTLTATFSDGSTATAVTTVPSTSPATLSLVYHGLLRDRVGQGTTALGPDGALDGTLTATLSASGGRTVTALRLDSSAPGTWDTSGGTAFWALAVAPTLDGAVLNSPGTMAVNFPVVDGGSFVVFAADYQGGEFLLGRTLTLTATFSDGSTATTVTTVTSTSPATLSLVYHGLLRDRVGQGTTALGPDGVLDGTLSATLSASGGRTVTALRLDSSAPGIWDTISGSPFWVLAVAPTLDGAVLNAPGTMAVNFPVVDGGSFVVFAADYQGDEFLPGRTLTLTATFSDGSTATAVTTVAGASPATLSLVYHGPLRDRVGQGTAALGPDGVLDGTLTATLSASGGRTVTALRLDSSAPGIWDTSGGTAFWALAVAPTLDAAVLNSPGTMAVNFPVADGGSFVVFAADYLASEFLPGRTLTLTATFSDGSTATTTTTVP